MAEAASTLRPLQLEQPSGVGLLGQFPASVSQEEPRIQSYPGLPEALATKAHIHHFSLLSTYCVQAPSLTPSNASSHFTLPATYEVSHILPTLLMRKPRHRLVKQFVQCHTANKWWGGDETRPCDSTFFPLHHKASCHWTLSSAPLTLRVMPWTELRNNLDALDRTQWGTKSSAWHT